MDRDLAKAGDRVSRLPPRVAVLPDFWEEGWPSMDLCADQLLAHWPTTTAGAITASRVVPNFRRLASRVSQRVGFNADRLLNRFVHYPRFVRRVANQYDAFHVVDHSYSQLVRSLPAKRTGVYCHDLDAFRCLLDPPADPRPRWFRAMARRILTGLQHAAIVFHNSEQTGCQLQHFKLVDPARLRHVPLGVAPEFHPSSTPVTSPALQTLPTTPWIAHIGSCIPRKRIDVLLGVFAQLRMRQPDLKLVKVGGEWTAQQRDQIAKLTLGTAIVHLKNLDRVELATVYRRASVVLVPSDAEGFGLPVIEALACGAIVVASDIPVLREAGGTAAMYAPVADVPAWVDVVRTLLASPTLAPAREQRLAWASQFSWVNHATTIAEAYRELLQCE